ncbi:MAG: histidinol-phosphate aminotransferase family protein [Micavibrio aeruginosavorus]|nr:histidinol-phosphate aminotransferase family protein [Micavibrio aeruginosavorus]
MQTNPAYDIRQEFGADYTPEVKQKLDFSNAENPLGCSPAAAGAIRQYAGIVHHYPALYGDRLAEALRDLHTATLPGFDILCTAGAGAGILLCVQAFIAPGGNVVLPELTFPLAVCGATIMGGAGRKVAVGNDLRLDLEALAKACDSATGMIFLCNPNNPTGEVIPPERIVDLCARVDVPVVVSEANADYAGISLLDLPALPRNLVMIRSFSKIYGLAGMRVGYIAAHGDVMRRLRQACCPFTVGVLAEQAALAALADTDHLRRSRAMMDRQRDLVTRGLKDMGLDVFPSQSNTVFFRAPQSFGSASEFAALLHALGCSVVDGGHFCERARHHVRITPRTERENVDFLNLVQEIAS